LNPTGEPVDDAARRRRGVAPTRRGPARQRQQRRREQRARRRAAEAGRRLFDLGWAWDAIAGLFHVAGRTLRQWCHDLLDFLKPPPLLGRPVARSARAARDAVIDLLDELGPGVGLPTLRDCFPAMRRAELADLLTRYRRVWRKRHRVPLRVLHWPVPGRVWAIDFAASPNMIDGRFSSVLAVRDLSSGMQLLWQPVEAATGDVAAAALAGLFARHGPPLVLKCDNGSAFTGAAVQDLLAAHQVECLLSPPYWPRYNGSVEAGIGSLKGRTEAHAARHGHAGYWTADDAAGALVEANALARPSGPTGPSPAEGWASRTPIAAAERAAFAARVAAQRELPRPAGAPCEAAGDAVESESAMARRAIRLALEECGYLHHTRRRILPPLRRRKAARIT
jgi:putative transposase